MKSFSWKIPTGTLSWLTSSLLALGADEAATQSAPDVTITPAATYIHADGNERQFREDAWMGDGWTGGVESFNLQQKLGKDTVLTLEGRGTFDEEDYKLGLEITKAEVGFIRAGFTQYRRYFDNRGGFYKPFSPNKFSSHKDLDLDIGDIFVDVGLRIPDIPQLTLGYERQYRDGKKSLLEWGSVTQTVLPPGGALPSGTVTKKIYPSYKDIDETVDIFKLDLAHHIGKVELGSEFRYENYQNTTKRVDGSVNLDTAASKSVSAKEDLGHDNFSNVFHVDSWCNEKTYWSLAYLFSTLHGGDGIALNTVPYNAPNDKDWFTRNLTLKQDSHVLSFNLLLGPWANFTTYGGVQAETTTTDGSASAVLTEFPDPIGTGPVAKLRSNNDKDSLEETLGVRFTGIPFTTVYAEGRWVEQDYDLSEKEFENGGLVGASAFKRFTETDVFRQQYTVGFNSSPCSRVTWAVKYRRSMKENNYDNQVDTTAGYPAFIKDQEFTTDDVSTKLNVRAHSKVKLTFGYQLVATEIETRAESIPSLSIPSGQVNSGNYDASIYSVGVTVTPISRMYWTAQASYTDARTITRDNHSHAVTTFDNNVYTVITALGIALCKEADLTLDYSYSRADDFNNNGYDKTPKPGFTNVDYGLPLGADNERMAASAALRTRFGKNVVATLRYGFYRLHDNGNGGIDDYTAHLASASCTLRF